MISKPNPNPNRSIADPVESQFTLASIWLARGQIERAIAGYRKVLELQPDHLQAVVHLTHLEERRKWSGSGAGDGLTDRPDGKLNLSGQPFTVAHRCGWSYALHALAPLHHDRGILFDGFLEFYFLYRANGAKEPYTRPWVGFAHNPQAMPEWYRPKHSPRALFAREDWLKSLESCLGLFTLSEYHARWLREQIDKPVSALIHPTEIPEGQFSFDRFLANPKKKIIQLGWWLRRLASIYQFPIARDNPVGYEKIKLNSAFSRDAEKDLQQLVNQQIEVENIRFDPRYFDNTRDLDHVSNPEYDTLLSENIGFLHLYDASANNAVIECIARATPLLVNPLPAVVEYLGENYPFYFHTLEEAAAKAMDLERIGRTHEYLKHCETRQKLSAEYFRESFRNSEVYRQVIRSEFPS